MGYALIAPQGNDSELIATAKSISAKAAGLPSALDTAQAEQAIKQPIWLYGNVQQASTTFGPLVLGKIEETKTMMEEMKAAGQAPMGDPTQAMEMCAGILDVFMKQTKSLSIAVNPKPSVLNITETISAVPGTEMADMFTADPSTKQENKLLGYLEDGAMINASGKVTGKLNAKAMDFFATVISKDMSPEDKAKLKSLASDIATVFGGNDAMSFSIDPKNKPPFAGKYVTEIKDKDKVNKVIEEGTALFNTGCVADFYESLGLKPTFTLKRAADSYKGVSIDSAKLIMAPTDANSPQAQMIIAMYGDGFNYRWGAVDGLWVCAYGGKVDSPIRELIDLVKAGGPKQMAAEIKTALALLPDADKADFFVTYNYVRVLKMLPAMMGAMMPVPMPEIDIPTKSNIVLAGKIGGGKMTIDIAVPKEHLTEIVSAFTMMMQQQMMMQQEMMQQRAMPGQPTTQPAGDNASITTTKANLRILHSAVNQFKMDTGRLPTEEEGLMALIEQPSDVTGYHSGGYLDTKQLPKDAWGNDFVYQLDPESGKPFVVISYGADGKAGGQGDNADLRN
jgi:general secretion pathway protein G